MTRALGTYRRRLVAARAYLAAKGSARSSPRAVPAHRRRNSSLMTLRWREPDSNHRSRVRKSGRCQVPAIQTRVGRTLTLGGGAESSQDGRDIELSVSPRGIRTSPYNLCANRSDRRQSREGDRWFESTSLQR